MRILVLGANGYLGSRLVHALVRSYGDDAVICTQRNISRSGRLDDLRGRVHIIPTSIDAIATVLQYEQIDAAVNMICNYSRSNLLYDSVLDANIEFPLNVLNLLTEFHIGRFLTIGTSLPPHLNMYSFSKAMLGEFGRYYAEKHGIAFTDVRLEMFYGSDEPRDRFLPDLIVKMLRGAPVDVTLGTQRRDILSADDAVRALQMLLTADLPGYQAIPVGTGEGPRIADIVSYIWEQTGRRSEVHFGAIPMRENEPDCVADLTKLRAIGQWQPVGWQTGLSQMIADIKKELEQG